MDTRAIEQMISQMRTASEVAAGKGTPSTGAVPGADFSSALQNAMAQVSEAQQSAQQMAQDFSAGNSEVNLQDVMVNLQKANLSFQQMVQVRNKLVSAYQDIMNMSV